MPDSIPPRPMFVPSVAPSDRPVAPHLQIWRWTFTMASSIFQRATGVALYGGFALFAIYLGCAAHSEGAYNAARGLLGSWFGVLALVGFTWAQMYHLCKGVLHLIWDGGHMIGKEDGQKATIIVFAASFALTALVWFAVSAMKG